MKIYSVNDKEFRAYGRVLDVDTADFVKAINNGLNKICCIYI